MSKYKTAVVELFCHCIIGPIIWPTYADRPGVIYMYFVFCDPQPHPSIILQESGIFYTNMALAGKVKRSSPYVENVLPFLFSEKMHYIELDVGLIIRDLKNSKYKMKDLVMNLYSFKAGDTRCLLVTGRKAIS